MDANQQQVSTSVTTWFYQPRNKKLRVDHARIIADKFYTLERAQAITGSMPIWPSDGTDLMNRGDSRSTRSCGQES